MSLLSYCCCFRGAIVLLHIALMHSREVTSCTVAVFLTKYGVSDSVFRFLFPSVPNHLHKVWSRQTHPERFGSLQEGFFYSNCSKKWHHYNMQLCSPSDIHVASRKKKKYIQISLDSVTVYFACWFFGCFYGSTSRHGLWTRCPSKSSGHLCRSQHYLSTQWMN